MVKSVPVSFDWKDTEGGLKQLHKALKEHGLHMQNSPQHAGSDQYGFHISNRKLSRTELRKADRGELEYGEGANMEHHGEGKPYGTK